MNKRESSLNSRFIILGAGPSGISCAVTLAKKFPNEKISILEKGICSLEEYVNRDLQDYVIKQYLFEFPEMFCKFQRRFFTISSSLPEFDLMFVRF